MFTMVTILVLHVVTIVTRKYNWSWWECHFFFRHLVINQSIGHIDHNYSTRWKARGSLKLVQFTLSWTWMSEQLLDGYMAIHPTAVETFYSSFHISHHKCEPHGGAKRKVNRVNPLENTNAWYKLMAIHPIVVETFQPGPTNRHCLEPCR